MENMTARGSVRTRILTAVLAENDRCGRPEYIRSRIIRRALLVAAVAALLISAFTVIPRIRLRGKDGAGADLAVNSVYKAGDTIVMTVELDTFGSEFIMGSELQIATDPGFTHLLTDFGSTQGEDPNTLIYSIKADDTVGDALYLKPPILYLRSGISTVSGSIKTGTLYRSPEGSDWFRIRELTVDKAGSRINTVKLALDPVGEDIMGEDISLVIDGEIYGYAGCELGWSSDPFVFNMAEYEFEISEAGIRDETELIEKAQLSMSSRLVRADNVQVNAAAQGLKIHVADPGTAVHASDTDAGSAADDVTVPAAVSGRPPARSVDFKVSGDSIGKDALPADELQQLLKDADTAYWEVAEFTVAGHTVRAVTEYYPPATADPGRPLDDATQYILNALHEFDLSGYEAGTESVSDSFIRKAAWFSSGDTACRVIFAIDDSFGKVHAITFQCDDGRTLEISTEGSDSAQEFCSALLITAQAGGFVRTDISGDLTVYLPDGTCRFRSQFISAITRTLLSACMEYGDPLSQSSFDPDRRLVFRDGSEYELDIENELILAPDGNIYRLLSDDGGAFLRLFIDECSD